jgi:hypothetical protein
MHKLSALKTPLYTLSILILCSFTNAASAADERWLGVWQAKDTLFTLRLVAKDDFLHIEPVQSLGFLWRNSPGRVNGDSAAFNVEYQGVLATVHVQLGEDGTAIARPVSCRPDYHVICALVQNQQALFQKISNAAQTAD